MLIRPEAPADEPAIDRVLRDAFAARSHTNHAEVAIVRALRDHGDLTLSLVAEVSETIVGHIAFSPVSVAGRHDSWFGLGPLAVRTGVQRQGFGSALVRYGLEDLRLRDAIGCVVLGDPRFYGRFGFLSDGRLRYKNLPARFVQRIVFRGEPPTGDITYARAFDLA
ncbi:MAG: N-acetyltransferase [Methyloceanibacter sp.]|nr:N-acetyltransferase [Methyloceanibacter sp.]